MVSMSNMTMSVGPFGYVLAALLLASACSKQEAANTTPSQDALPPAEQTTPPADTTTTPDATTTPDSSTMPPPASETAPPPADTTTPPADSGAADPAAPPPRQ